MPYTVQGVDPKLKWYQELGRTQGHVANMLLQALIGQMGGASNIPNPGYGQTGSPGTQFSQPQPGQLSPPQNPQQIKQGFVPRTQASPFASQPMLNKQQFETLQSLQTYQQNAAMAPLELKALQTKIDAQKGGIPYFNLTTGEIEYSQPFGAKGIPGTGTKEKSARELAQEAEFNATGTQTLKKPDFVDQADWDAATDEQKRALLSRLGLL